MQLYISVIMSCCWAIQSIAQTAYSLNGEPDSLYVVQGADGLPEYCLLWKGDTIASDWSYSGVQDFVVPLDVLGADNIFLMRTHAGDGCPTLYRIAHWLPEGKWSVPEAFGNCNEAATINIIAGKTIRFTFPGTGVPKRPAATITYDILRNTVQSK